MVQQQITPAAFPVHVLQEELTGSPQAILRLDTPAEFGGALSHRRIGHRLAYRPCQSL